jgi:signal transduction histidine kinase
MLIFLIVVTSLTQLILSLFIFFRARNNLSNQLFFLIGVTMLGWALSDFFSVQYLHSENVVYFARLVLFFVVLQNAFFYMFARTFPEHFWKHSKSWLLAYWLFTIAVAAITLSHFVFRTVDIREGRAVTEVGPVIVLFLIHAVLSTVIAIRALLRKMKRSTGVIKRQIQIILIGAFLVWIVVPITNFGITQAVGTTIFTKYAPLYTLAFSSIIAYAIVAKKLFDIKAAVARSVGYVLVLGAVAVTYSIIFFGVINVLYAGAEHQMARQILAIVLVASLSLAFQPLRQYFDRWTNRLFYRESYDPQDVLDRLGNIVVAEFELYKILNHTRAVLSEALKSSFIEFIVLKDGRPHFEARTSRTVATNIMALGAEVSKQQMDILEAESGGLQTNLQRHLDEAGVALSLRLRTHEQVVGYVLFGDKRSGDLYTPQDRKLLLILASELAIAVQNALRFEEIQNFNLTLQARVEEATRKLRRANEKLREMDETKDDFISMASHQLRTPLTSVKGYTSMVLEGDAGKLTATQRKLLNQSFFSAQRMVYLIADLLNVSRLKTGKFVVERTPVNLADVVEEEVAQLQESAAARSLKLTYAKPKKFPEVMLDETKTRQVIMNFIDNAIYYTPTKGHIDVSLTETPTTLEFRVKDNGIGVPKSEQPHLFTKFYRAGNARHARPDGTGLGLFMAKKVVLVQGGAVIFESKEGKGSTFGFIFSKHKLAEEAKKAAPAPEAAAAAGKPAATPASKVQATGKRT